MFTLSAFADEISPDPREQVAVLKKCRVRFIEFRSIHKTNVLALSDEQIREFKKLLDGEGIGLSAIGSPIGKIAIDAPFEPHLDKLKRAIELCGVFGTRGIRVNAVAPFVTVTDMTADLVDSDAGRDRMRDAALGRFGRADEVADTVIFLLSDAASLYTGQTLNPNAGAYMP